MSLRGIIKSRLPSTDSEDLANLPPQENPQAIQEEKIREQRKLELIRSRNLLAVHTPYIIAYVLTIYAICILVVSYLTCQPFHLSNNCQNAWVALHIEGATATAFHYFTAGAFAGTVILVYLQIFDAEKKGFSWNSRLYCTGKIRLLICTAYLITNAMM